MTRTSKVELKNRAVIRFGKAVKEARISLGWTQMELASEAGLDVAHVSRIERAEKDISLSTAVRLAEALGIKIYFGEQKLC